MKCSWDISQNPDFRTKFELLTPLTTKQEFSVTYHICWWEALILVYLHAQSQKNLMKCSWRYFPRTWSLRQNWPILPPVEGGDFSSKISTLSLLPDYDHGNFIQNFSEKSNQQNLGKQVLQPDLLTDKRKLFLWTLSG